MCGGGGGGGHFHFENPNVKSFLLYPFQGWIQEFFQGGGYEASKKGKSGREGLGPDLLSPKKPQFGPSPTQHHTLVLAQSVNFRTVVSKFWRRTQSVGSFKMAFRVGKNWKSWRQILITGS